MKELFEAMEDPEFMRYLVGLEFDHGFAVVMSQHPPKKEN